MILSVPLAAALVTLPQNAPVPTGPPRPTAAAAAGQLPYETYCATCHGADLRGGVNAPSLRGRGAADLDFWLTTGRMPAAVPWIEEGHRGQALPDPVIRSIIAYVTAAAPGGLPIPVVAAGGDVKRGRALFEQNCMHCHGVNAQGASIGTNEWAPALYHAPITQVAEAIRLGPGEMPAFGDRQLDDRALVDVATYVVSLDEKAATHEVPFTSSGPVPEGLLGWLAVAVLSVFAFMYSRGSKEGAPRA